MACSLCAVEGVPPVALKFLNIFLLFYDCICGANIHFLCLIVASVCSRSIGTLMDEEGREMGQP